MKQQSSAPPRLNKRLLALGYLTVLAVVITMVVAIMLIVKKDFKNNLYDQTDMLTEAYSAALENEINRVYFELDKASKNKEIGEKFNTLAAEELQTYLIGAENAKTNDFMFYTLSILTPEGVTYDGYDLSAREYVTPSGVKIDSV